MTSIKDIILNPEYLKNMRNRVTQYDIEQYLQHCNEEKEYGDEKL